MSRLHKKINNSLTFKYYIFFLLFILFGLYKNGLVPFIHGYSNLKDLIMVFLYPLLGFGLGVNSKFFGLLYIMILPISTNILLTAIFISLYLFIYNELAKRKINHSINLIVIFKLLLGGILGLFHSYFYENALESSSNFQYSFLDLLIGHNISGIFTSNIIIIFIAFIILCFDEYYKKEIVWYSLGIYIINLLIYTVFKENLGFFLIHTFSSTILFALVFIATLSYYSPYTKKTIFLYSIILGLLILPCSILTNFYEGVYIAILLANLLSIGIFLLNEKWKIKLNLKRNK